MLRVFPRVQLAALVALILVPLGYVRGVMNRGDDEPMTPSPFAGFAAGAATQFGLASFGRLDQAFAAPVPTEAEKPTVKVTLYAVNFLEYQEFEITRDGEVSPDEEPALEQFFRCKRSGRKHVMHPGVLRVLVDLSEHYPDHVIEIVSGFRRRGFGARHSKHYTGHAIDLRVRGVGIAKVRDYLWSRYPEIGLGHYTQQNFLHVDHRPGEPKVGWTQRRPDGPNHYDPWWTTKSNDPISLFAVAEKQIREHPHRREPVVVAEAALEPAEEAAPAPAPKRTAKKRKHKKKQRTAEDAVATRTGAVAPSPLAPESNTKPQPSNTGTGFGMMMLGTRTSGH
jgi:uncharacterized protein YcbK (DUF882 family)